MPKNLNDNKQSLTRIIYYRWEFLRRNPEYQKEYVRLINTKWSRKQRFISMSEWTPQETKYSTRILHAICRFTDKWEISIPGDPNLHIPLAMLLKDNEKLQQLPHPPFDQISHVNYHACGVSRIPKTKDSLDKIRPDYIAGCIAYFKMNPDKSPMPLDELTEDTLRPLIVKELNSSILKLDVNMTAPKDEIVEHFIRFLDQEIEKRKEQSLPVFDEKRPRNRLDVYDDYLKIWDLRTKGNTFQDIAIKLAK